MLSINAKSEAPIGVLVILEQYFHQHYSNINLKLVRPLLQLLK